MLKVGDRACGTSKNEATVLPGSSTMAFPPRPVNSPPGDANGPWEPPGEHSAQDLANRHGDTFEAMGWGPSLERLNPFHLLNEGSCRVVISAL
jgi:hypothetical protein